MSRAAEPALPAAFVARMRALLGAEADELIAALAGPPASGLRVNPLRFDLSSLAAATGWRVEPLPWSEHAATVDAGGDRPGLHPLHEAGAYYLQDPSATVPATVLDAKPGERIADLAAAPGGKATQLASALRGEGLLLANDVHPERVRALARNLERWGVRNAVVTQEPPDRLAGRLAGTFDAVLLDAPCSGEGMFRKSTDAAAMWSEDVVRTCARRQAPLLDAAADLLAPGGRLVYATCTFAPEENEEAVAALLARRSDLRPDPFDLPGMERGRPEWAPGLDAATADRLARATARAWPHRSAGDGHFVARLRKDRSAPDPPRRARVPHARRPGSATRAGTAAPPAALRAWRTFRDDALAPGAVTGPSGEDRPVLRGEGLWLPVAPVALAGARTLRDGLLLGRWRKGRFEPSHALAQALAADEMRTRLELAQDPARIAAYLAGAELESAVGADGPGSPWRLVTVHGAPLGWARRSGPRLRNLYPKGLRRG